MLKWVLASELEGNTDHTIWKKRYNSGWCGFLKENYDFSNLLSFKWLFWNNNRTLNFFLSYEKNVRNARTRCKRPRKPLVDAFPVCSRAGRLCTAICSKAIDISTCILRDVITGIPDIRNAVDCAYFRSFIRQCLAFSRYCEEYSAGLGPSAALWVTFSFGGLWWTQMDQSGISCSKHG